MLKLNVNEKVINDIYDGLSSGHSKIKLSNKSDFDDVMLLYKLCLSKYPEIINVDYGRLYIQTDICTNYLMVMSKVGWHKIKRANCKFTLEDSKFIDNYAVDIVKRLNIASKSDMKKAVAIYDFLSETVTYEETENAHDAWGALIDKKAVCEGVSYAFCLLAKKCGLESVVVDGLLNGQSHAWNIVSIDNKPYHLDVTSNLDSKENGINNYDYIFLQDSDMKNREWNRKIYPMCNHQQHNYFMITHSYASNDDDAINIITRQIDKHKIVYFRCSSNLKLNEMWVQHLFIEACKKQNYSFSSLSIQINPIINSVLVVYK